jgi:two-component system NtrC family sensor kinase
MIVTDPADEAADRGCPAATRHHAGAFRLLWAGAIALPLVALVFGGLSAWNGVIRYETEAMIRTVDMVNEQTLRALETQDAVLAALEAHIDGMSWQQIAADPALHRFVRRLADATPNVFDMGIISPDGRLVVSSETVDPPGDRRLSERDYVRAFPPGAVSTSTFISDAIVRSSTGRVHVHVARARRGPEGRADGGVLTTAFAPAYFERFFAEIAETEATGFILVRNDGSVLARYPVQVAAAGERLAADDPILLAARAAPAGALVQVVRSGSLFSGFHLFAVRRAGDYPLLIAYGADPALVQRAWLRQTIPLAAGGLTVMALLMLLTAQVQRRLAAERASLVRRTATAEQGQAVAQTRAELEARLRQTEKVAALGHLSAGVAHDFNNLMQSIVISAEALTRPDLPAQEVHDIGALILRVGERGMALTRRMLDYARHDEQSGGDTDVAASLQGVRELLVRSLGPQYRLQLDLAAPEGLWARGHPAEFETVIINLAVNARDAMPEGGNIAIVVTGVEETRPRAESGLTPGRYLHIAVTDSGHGMDTAALARAGEAFFTTKPRGQGTGLGLSMARGFARRCGGKLDLASVPGRGTTVTLWLPAA